MEIVVTKEVQAMYEVFPEAWHSRIASLSTEKLLNTRILLTAVLRADGRSGCCLLHFDGMLTLFNLWTPPGYRGRGYAQGIVRMSSHPSVTEGKIILARYREDEAEVARIFAKTGYDVIHVGTDKFVIVTSRRSDG